MEKLTTLIFIASILTFGCAKEETSKNNYLQGTWVESEFKTDTIQFQNSEYILWLNRGTEIRNDYILPKMGSGPYTYNIQEDSIYLRSLLSSSLASLPCYFYIDGDKLTIGNFYDQQTLNKMLLEFKKIE